MASPAQSFGFWRVSPLEYIIFVGAVLWSIFYSIESGIYWSLASSVVLLLFRIARPKGNFLGRVRIRPEDLEAGKESPLIRDVYVPLVTDGSVTNGDVKVEAPPPGVIIYRFEESFLYPNASYINDRLVSYAKEHTRRGKDYSGISAGDRPWNDPGPKQKNAVATLEDDKSKPRLKAVILDFAAVANLDTTGVQNLIDTRNEVERWADAPVEFHFSGILSPWIRRALIAGGFGTGAIRHGIALEVAPVVPTDDALSPADKARKQEEREAQASASSSSSASISGDEKQVYTPSSLDGLEAQQARRRSDESQTTLPLLDRATPFFHFDLADALHSIGH